jgi:small subunit ribosomal protein S1
MAKPTDPIQPNAQAEPGDAIPGRKRVARTRKADRKAHRAKQEAEAEARREAQAERREAPVQVESPQAPAPKLATDDLLAIAQMDKDELAALMEGAVRPDALETGAEVKGTITRVNDQQILVDIGGKSEAWMERGELPEAELGQSVTAYVLHAGESAVRLSMQLSGQAASAFLDEALASGIPVEGHVASANKGGFEVRIGDTRAFCPRSLISRHYVEAPEAFVGQTLQFKVIEIDEQSDKIVLSRRALEEERAEEFAKTFWQDVKVGQTLEGVIRNVQPFGVFVDVGGVDGLIPRSELGWGDDSPADLYGSGEEVTVRVIDVNPTEKKLTLSMKNPDQAPWKRVGSEFVEGGVYDGTVARVTSFGAFIRLADGLDGLVHVSKLARGLPKQGDAMQVRVLSIDHERQRIALAPFVEGEVPEGAGPDIVLQGTVAEVLRNGVVVQLDDGRTGWLPAGEVDLPAGTVLSQRFRRGKGLQARVKDDSRGNRVTLTMKTQADDDWRQHVKPAGAKKKAEGFGTLGDLFAGLDLPKK